MMRMKIKLDEQKVKENGEYTVDEMYKKIDDLAKKVNITKKDKEGAFVGNNDRYDFASFGRMIIALGDCDWYKNCVEEWLWYDDYEVDDMMDFLNRRSDVV